MKLLSRNEEIIMLAVLHLKDNAYGVTIRELASRLTGYKWSFGDVYVPLDKLTHKGNLEKTISSPLPQRGGRSKCLYRLTAEGKIALKTIRRVQNVLWKDIPDRALD
jgi:DNA-binding PadR family transcriptional regulator